MRPPPFSNKTKQNKKTELQELYHIKVSHCLSRKSSSLLIFLRPLSEPFVCSSGEEETTGNQWSQS